MERIALLTSAAIALAAPAFAQDEPQNPLAANQPDGDSQPADTEPSTTDHSTNVYHGPHRYPLHTRGRAGDPPVVEHSADTPVVEPTHSTITVMVPAEPPQQ